MSTKRCTDEFKVEAVRQVVEYSRPVANWGQLWASSSFPCNLEVDGSVAQSLTLPALPHRSET